MKKIIFLLLTVLLIIGCSYSPVKSLKYNVAIAKEIFYDGVITPMVIGSGILLDEHYVLSAAHVILDEFGDIATKNLVAITYDKNGAILATSSFSVVKIDKEGDTVLLKTDENMHPYIYICPMKLAVQKPEQWEEIYVIGNPHAEVNVIITGRVAKNTITAVPYLMFLDARLYPGNSGSGVYNQKGELVGIVQRLYPDGIGQWISTCTNIETIREFLDTFKTE